MKLSNLIIDYRKQMNISQREFSRRCDLSNSYISFLEKEVNPKTGKPLIPTLEQYKKLADGMGITVHRLFELLDEDSPVDLHHTSSEDPDLDRLEALHQDPRLGMLFDRSRKMKPEDVDFMLQMADRILKERDGE